MDIIRNGLFFPHQAIILTNQKNIHDFNIDKVILAYNARKGCIGKDSAVWEIEFHLTNRCNLKCGGCSYGTRHDNQSISIDQVIKILNNYLVYDPKSIFFSGGGDPLTWPHWKEFFATIEKKYNYGIATNMFNFDAINEYYKLFDFYQIHLTGYDKESCKVTTGRDCFNLINNNIDFLLRHRTLGQDIAIKVLINESNYLQVQQYLEYIINKNTDSIIIKFQQDFLNNRDLSNGDIFDSVRKIVYSHSIINKYDYLIDNLDDVFYNAGPCPSICFFACSGLYRLVNAYGEIFPCIAANANRKNKIRTNDGFVDIYSNEMRSGKCPLKACRHYRFSQRISQIYHIESGDFQTSNLPLLL